jgi:hypothetical protein
MHDFPSVVPPGGEVTSAVVAEKHAFLPTRSGLYASTRRDTSAPIMVAVPPEALTQDDRKY